MVNMLEQY